MNMGSWFLPTKLKNLDGHLSSNENQRLKAHPGGLPTPLDDLDLSKKGWDRRERQRDFRICPVPVPDCVAPA